MSKSETELMKEAKKARESQEKITETLAIEGSPFRALKVDEDWYLTFGKTTLEKGTSYEEIVKKANRPVDPWRIVEIAHIICEAQTESITEALMDAISKKADKRKTKAK